MATDSPDWQEVVTLISGGTVTDAPDWQRTVTGPGATPPVAGGSSFPDPVLSGTVARSIPAWACAGAVQNASGQLFGTILTPISSGTVTQLGAFVRGAATGETTAQQGIGLYTIDLASQVIDLVASASDISFGDNGSPWLYTFTLSSSYDVTAGTPYYVVTLQTASTTPSYFSRPVYGSDVVQYMPAQSSHNAPQTFTVGSGITALPASISIASGDISPDAFVPYFAILS